MKTGKTLKVISGLAVFAAYLAGGGLFAATGSGGDGAWKPIRYPDFMKSRPQLKGTMLGLSREQEFKDLHEMGATLVRYPLHAHRGWSQFTNSTDDVAAFNVWLDERLDHLEEMLPWARKYGIRICVDLHVVLGGGWKHYGEGVSDYAKSEPIFVVKKAGDLLVATWVKIATRFRGNEDAIYGYDIYNEPMDRENKYTVTTWRELFSRTVEAIRAIDPVTPIVIEPNCHASPRGFDVKNIYGLSGFEPLPYDNLIYSVHVYQPIDYTHQGLHKKAEDYEPRPWPGWSRKLDANRVRFAGDDGGADDTGAAGERWDKEYVRKQIQGVRDFQLRTGARIFVGEFSAAAYAPGAERYIEDLCELFREYGWDWTYHAFRESECWSFEREGPSFYELKKVESTPRKAVLEKFFRDGTPSGGAGRPNAAKANPGAVPLPAERRLQGGYERIGGGRFRVLIYGNSIVFHGSHPPIGWTNNWGMAASAKEKDFAHLVVKGLEEMRGEPADYRLANIAGLEHTFATNATQVAKSMAQGVAFEPDYVVIAVGENCGVDFKQGRDLEAFKRFLENLARPFAESPKHPKIVLRSSFWPDCEKAKATKEVADAVGATYVDGGIGGIDENKAKGLFSNSGVAAHPGDLGMRRLAEIVLKGFAK